MSVTLVIDPSDLVRRRIMDAECGEWGDEHPGPIPGSTERERCGRRLWVSKWNARDGATVQCPTHGEVLLPTRLAFPVQV